MMLSYIDRTEYDKYMSCRPTVKVLTTPQDVKKNRKYITQCLSYNTKVLNALIKHNEGKGKQKVDIGQQTLDQSEEGFGILINIYIYIYIIHRGN